MKRIRTLLFPTALCLTLSFLAAPLRAADPDHSQISVTVGRLLEQHHYNQQKLDEEVGKQILVNYIEALDHSRLYFTQADVDTITQKYGANLDSRILLGNASPAVEIYTLFRKRVEERIAKVKQWIEKDHFDFKSSRTVAINRQKLPWPKDSTEADRIWHDRIENEFLQERLSKQSDGDPKKVLNRRYGQVLKNLEEQTDADAVNTFISVIAQTYDPHSDYLTKDDLEDFSISMKLSLVGIGAVLQSDEGYAKIMELVVGGPAHKEGELKVGDRIAAVAQGDEEFVDTVDMKLNRVVRMIRGAKGTTVRLQVLPAQGTDGNARKVISIVRDEVKIKDKEAKAELIEKKDSKGNPIRLGLITLPLFYSDMDKPGKSTTDDMLRLLNRLKKENIAGLIIDLRNNGGGSLDEAVRLTGLFIRKGPVVQVKSANGTLRSLRDTDPEIAYDGPLIVLTNTLSASASEIFAGALQDYGRALIVGDRHTFGKGTVQTVLDIGRFIPYLGGGGKDAGALKLTIQKFYRVAGGSTQLNGVSSDIVLPSIYDQDEIGEKSLKNPLPHDEVPAAVYDKIADVPLFADELRELSKKRVEADPEFKFIRENQARVKKRIEENTVSLNEKVRRDEIAKNKEREKAMEALRAKRKAPEEKSYEITLDNVDKPELQLVANPPATPEKEADKKPPVKKNADETGLDDDESDSKVDAVKDETVRILNDMVELSRSRKTASVITEAPQRSE